MCCPLLGDSAGCDCKDPPAVRAKIPKISLSTRINTHDLQVVFAFVTRVFDFLTDVVLSGAGLVAPMRRVDCSNLAKENSSAPGTSNKNDDLQVLYQQVRLPLYFTLRLQHMCAQAAKLTFDH
jgi:hypothetical protein